nr:MAG TPA: hypothetical protein [Caudoviricetes sp.]
MTGTTCKTSTPNYTLIGCSSCAYFNSDSASNF